MARRKYTVEKADFRRFHNAISEGPTSFYLRGHLLLERILLQGVKANVKYPEKLQKANMKMATLVDLVASFGLIDDGMVDILRYIDAVRNNFAHSLDFELTEAVPKRLIELFETTGVVPIAQATWQQSLEVCMIIAYAVLDGQVKKQMGPAKRKAKRK